MKSLFFGIVLIILLGVGGFAYRSVMENTTPLQRACTAEAKICPDGSSVGRTGPACEFTPCAFPNISLTDAQIAFALPQGYEKGVQEPGADGFVEGMLEFYQKSATSGHHYITLYQYPVAEGETAEQVIVKNTVLSPSGEQVSGMEKFTPVLIQGKTFQHIVIERFEGQVASAYYLVRASDVLRFDVIESDVDWTNPDLVIENLPEHQALLKMLSTLQSP